MSDIANTCIELDKSNKYEKFEQALIKLKRFLDWVISHRIAILSCLAVLTVITFALLYFSGTFLSEFSCDSSIVYGNTESFRATTLFTIAQYEYSADNGNTWSTEMPSQHRPYMVRAFTVSPFGTKRYSNTDDFLLLKRDLMLTLNGHYQYGDDIPKLMANDIVAVSLAEGDRVDAASIRMNKTSSGANRYEAVIDTVKILNSQGRDVTGIYNIKRVNIKYTLSPRKLTIAFNNTTKVYDGNDDYDNSYRITSGSLAEGDSLRIVVPKYGADAGIYEIGPSSYRVTDKNGYDVTSKYSINIITGRLKIKHIPLTFKTGSAEKDYDGQPIECPDWELTSGSLLNGHTMEAKPITVPVAWGSYSNLYEFTIYNERGTDVTHNYKITQDAGTLDIHPTVLYFSTDSATKVYDGTPLTASGFKHVGGELLTGHTMICYTNGSLTLAGSTENTLFVQIKDANGKDVTLEGYHILVEEGLLTVTPISIAITSDSATAHYNGYPLTCHRYTITEGQLVSSDMIIPHFTGSQTEVGESPNYFNVKISSTNIGYADTTGCYHITYSYGTLTVLPANAPLPGGNGGGGSGGGSGGGGGGSGSGSGSGSGGNGTPPDYTSIGFVSPDQLSNAISSGYLARVKIISDMPVRTLAYLRQASYGDYTGDGFTIAVPFKTQGHSNSRVSPIDIVGQRAVKKFDNIYHYKMQIQTKDPNLTLTPYFTYDSADLFGTNDVYYSGDTTNYTVGFYNISNYKVLETLKDHDSDMKRISEYTDFVRSRYLQIPISTYNAMRRIANDHGLKKSNIIDTINAVKKYISNAGVYDMKAVNLYNDPASKEDIAVYFLETAKRGICQHFACAGTMMFRALGIPARYTTGFATTVNSDGFTPLTIGHAWVEVYIETVGWVPVDVTGSQGLSTSPSGMFTVQAYSLTKEYDGKTFSKWDDKPYKLLNAFLEPGHTVRVTLSESGYGQTQPGEYINKIASFAIVDANGQDVTAQYGNVQLLDGKMTILKRKISVQSASDSKKYDGTLLTNDNWWISSGSLAYGHEIRVQVEGAALNPGDKVSNDIKSVNIYATVDGQEIDVTHYYDILTYSGILKIHE